MTYLRKILIFAFWTCAAIVFFFLLNLFFVFGDCVENIPACRQAQDIAAQIVSIVVACVYGLGLGVMLERWVLNGVR